MTNFLFHILVWPLWLLVLTTPFYSLLHTDVIRAVLEESDLNIHLGASFPLIAALVVFVALSEGLATLLLRYFVLARPVRLKSLSVATAKGRLRFLVVSLVNWFISVSLSAYGVVLFVLFTEPQFVYFFSAFGFALMIIHVPRLYSFEIREEE